MELRAAPAQGRSHRTIELIIASAESLIAKDGNVSFTSTQLATLAGTSAGRLYYWFPNLPAVITALMERIETDTPAGCGIQAATAAHPALAVLAVDGSTGLHRRALAVIERAAGLPAGDQRALAIAALHLPWLDPDTSQARQQLTIQLLDAPSSSDT